MHLQTAFIALLLSSCVLALPSPNSLLSRENRATPLQIINPSNPKLPLRPLPFDGTSCDPASRRFLREHFTEALTVVDNVINTATSESIPFRTFFRDDPDNPDNGRTLKSVMKTFKGIKNLLTTPDRQWKITCGNTACGRETMAWARVKDMHLNFCNDIFHYKTLGALTELKRVPAFEDIKCKPTSHGTLTLDTQTARMPEGPSQIDTLGWLPAHTILHELSHLFYVEGNEDNHIADCFYGAYAAEFLAIHHPRAALAYADNYAWFAIAQYLNTLCEGDVDEVYYRAWRDKWYIFQTHTFKNQFDLFNKRKNAKVQLRLELGKIRKDLNTLQNDMIEAGGVEGRTLMKNGSPVDMTDVEKRRLEGLRVRVDDTGEKLRAASMELDGYSELTCDLKVTWRQVLEIMDGRAFMV